MTHLESLRRDVARRENRIMTTGEWLINGLPASNAALAAAKGTIVSGDGTRYVETVVGSNGKVLTADSTVTGGASWQTAASPAVGNIGTVWASQQTLDGSGNVTLTAPDVVGAANLYPMVCGGDNAGSASPALGTVYITSYSNTGPNNVTVASSLGAGDSGKKVFVHVVYY